MQYISMVDGDQELKHWPCVHALLGLNNCWKAIRMELHSISKMVFGTSGASTNWNCLKVK